jgi:DNA mismatch repair protein MutL
VIRRLPETLVNQIAAGEVIERPAAALKELVENAIDAGARRVDVTLKESGKAAIVVADDGRGMTREELLLAVERHATSKLPEDDLTRILTFGFRGEALPSIGAVGRLTITSRALDSREGWTIRVEGGARSGPEPAAHPQGTRVEVRDLFFATPARLKFLKGDRAELLACIDAIERLAMANPAVAFSVGADGRSVLRLPSLGDAPDARLQRLAAVIDREFFDNALTIDAEREGVRLTGHASLPTFHRATAQMQYLFVNGRPVRDRLLGGAVRGAYADFLARDRHPVVALFVDLPPDQVDVNVHPAKSEVRFRDAGLVRGLVVGALKHALAGAGFRAATTPGLEAMAAFRPGFVGSRRRYRRDPAWPRPRRHSPSRRPWASARRRRAWSRRTRRCRLMPRATRWAWRARSSSRPTSSPRATRASSSSISTPRMKGSSTSASRASWRRRA